MAPTIAATERPEPSSDPVHEIARADSRCHAGRHNQLTVTVVRAMIARLPLALVLGGAVAACASTPTPPPSSAHLTAPIPTTATSPFASDAGTVVPALTVDHPTLTVSPSTHLTDGQTVEVRVTGFGVGGKVWLSECISAAAASDLGCRAALADQPFLVTDINRAGSARFVVRDSAFDRAVFPYPPRVPSRCLDQCVLVVTLGSGLPYIVAPIAFATP